MKEIQMVMRNFASSYISQINMVKGLSTRLLKKHDSNINDILVSKNYMMNLCDEIKILENDVKQSSAKSHNIKIGCSNK